MKNGVVRGGGDGGSEDTHTRVRFAARNEGEIAEPPSRPRYFEQTVVSLGALRRQEVWLIPEPSNDTIDSLYVRLDVVPPATFIMVISPGILGNDIPRKVY